MLLCLCASRDQAWLAPAVGEPTKATQAQSILTAPIRTVPKATASGSSGKRAFPFGHTSELLCRNAGDISAPSFLAYLCDLSAWEAAKEVLSAASISKESLKRWC